MRGAQQPFSGPGPVTIALRIVALTGVVVAATWAAHLIRDALDLTIMPASERQVHRAIMLGSVAYVGLLALPFVPGAEIGIAMLSAFGAAIAPLVHAATVVSMMLARLWRGCGGKSRAAVSGRRELVWVRRAGQGAWARRAVRGFAGRRSCASGPGLRRGGPGTASARSRRRAGRPGS